MEIPPSSLVFVVTNMSSPLGIHVVSALVNLYADGRTPLLMLKQMASWFRGSSSAMTTPKFKVYFMFAIFSLLAKCWKPVGDSLTLSGTNLLISFVRVRFVPADKFALSPSLTCHVLRPIFVLRGMGLALYIRTFSEYFKFMEKVHTWSGGLEYLVRLQPRNKRLMSIVNVHEDIGPIHVFMMTTFLKFQSCRVIFEWLRDACEEEFMD